MCLFYLEFSRRKARKLDFELTKPSTGQDNEYSHARDTSFHMKHKREEQHQIYGGEDNIKH
jgi:hypothetical protein